MRNVRLLFNNYLLLLHIVFITVTSLKIEKTNGERCTYRHKQCKDDSGLLCFSQKCQCKNDKYKFENGKCLLKNPKNYGEECTSQDAECTGKNQGCISGKCLCHYGFARFGDECRRCKKILIKKYEIHVQYFFYF